MLFFEAKCFYIMKPKATCHITRQASINARASVRYPILTVKQTALLARDKSFHIKFENRRRDVISLNQARGMSAKMSANGIRTRVSMDARNVLFRTWLISLTLQLLLRF